MSYRVDGTSIYLTRGDTFEAPIQMLLPDSKDEYYTPTEGDEIRFALKETYTDRKPILIKEIPIDTLMLTLDPDDTSDLNFGKYVYDIQITFGNGKVDTFITKARLHLLEEVD